METHGVSNTDSKQAEEPKTNSNIKVTIEKITTTPTEELEKVATHIIKRKTERSSTNSMVIQEIFSKNFSESSNKTPEDNRRPKRGTGPKEDGLGKILNGRSKRDRSSIKIISNSSMTITNKGTRRPLKTGRTALAEIQ